VIALIRIVTAAIALDIEQARLHASPRSGRLKPTNHVISRPLHGLRICTRG
jgi:hypothetical protein